MRSAECGMEKTEIRDEGVRIREGGKRHGEAIT
jgi:hypothetical protein